ncbi:MAG: rod shape-determining protein MreC [Alphaproteobacteria bacterium]
MRYRPGMIVRLTTPMRAAIHRFAYAALFFAAAGMIIIGKADVLLAERLRITVADAFAPVLDAVSRPAATVQDMIDDTHALFDLREENSRLRLENERLRHWQQAARQMEAESRILREMLNYQPPQEPRVVSARVISDSSSAYVRSLLVAAGEAGGVRRGQAAIDGTGLVGRVTEVGQRAARILLVTDINSRVPVVMEQSRHAAILSGDNSDRPRLRFLPVEAQPRLGDRIVTSGQGGIFPPGIPVGIVAQVSGGEIRVQPLAKLDRLEYIRLADFGMGDVLPPVSARPPARP